MCGRYAQGRAIPNLLARYAHLAAEVIAEQQGFLTYNAAPGSLRAVVYAENGHTWLGPMRWGLVPRWAKSLSALKQKPINARSETADAGAFFRDAFRTGRCLVPATGFYEWQGARPPKRAFYIHATDQDICSFAGLWSRWNGPGGEDLLTFAILTTAANAVVLPVHDRMPCILRPGDEAAWLDPSTRVADAKVLLRPYPAEATDAYPVASLVNRPATDGPELITPVLPPKAMTAADQA